MVWCTCPLRHLGTDQNKDGNQVSIINPSFLGARGLGVEMSSASGLEYTHDGLVWSFLRYYLLCWTTPKILLTVVPYKDIHLDICREQVQVLARVEARKEAKETKQNRFFFHGVPLVSLSPYDLGQNTYLS